MHNILGECMALWGEPVWFDHLHAPEYTDKQCGLNYCTTVNPYNLINNIRLLVTISIHTFHSLDAV